MAPRAARRLLVAAPLIGDPNFERTVVYVIDHDDHGALGVVLNRPTDMAVAEPLPAWATVAAEPAVVFQGGPVDTSAAIALARRSGPPTDGWAPLHDDVGTVDLGADPAALGISTVRIFAGYAGWAAGQLDDEIDEGAWYVVDATPADLFHPRPAELWRAVLARQPGRLRWLAHHPADPRWN